MSRPTLSETITIAEFWKNRSAQSIRISLSTWKGRNLVDVRTWNTEQGRLKPTTKGFTAEVKHLPRLVSALVKACRRARELGLIASDDGGAQ